MKPTAKNILISILLIAVLFALPAVLAPILHRPHIASYLEYGGKESDWITFWGNYLGAVITGLISFVILWFTIQKNKEENLAIINNNQLENSRIIEENRNENTRILEANAEIEKTKRKQEYYLRFRNEVSIRLSKIDFLKFFGIYIEFDSPYKEAKFRLESFHAQLTEDFNSFLILYDGECDEFIEEYRKVVDLLTERIREFLLLFKEMDDSWDDFDVKEEIQKKIKEKEYNLKDLKPIINDLWKKAKEEIDKLKL